MPKEETPQNDTKNTLRLAISLADYLRVIGVAALLLLWFACIVWLNWANTSDGARKIGVTLMLALAFITSRLCWIYRPHVTSIYESAIVAGPAWSGSILDRDFEFIDIKTGEGMRRRVRYVRQCHRRQFFSSERWLGILTRRNRRKRTHDSEKCTSAP